MNTEPTNTINNPDVYASYSFAIAPTSNKINKRIYKVKNSLSYEIITYDKSFLCQGEPAHNTQYRSVIFSYPEHELLSFSPPKSITFTDFYQKYPLSTTLVENIYVNEMIEGTLIHLFYDNRIQSWEIATKNAVGGQYSVFRSNAQDPLNQTKSKKTTVYKMFLDAMRMPESTPLNQCTMLEYFPKQFSYSMVLQHPDNHIILPIEFPALYLVAVYDVVSPFQDNLRAIAIPPSVFQEWNCFMNMPIFFPATIELSNDTNSIYRILSERFNVLTPTDYKMMGIMIINTATGDRCSIRNPVYQEVLRVREMDTCQQYQYLCLRRIDHVDNYLKMFPGHKTAFSKFYEQYQRFVENVHSAYMDQYVYKINVNQNPGKNKYSQIIQRLQKEIYLPSLSRHNRDNNNVNTSCKITRKVVNDYIHKMEPAEILYFLNFEKREYYLSNKIK